mgnify:FL=1
MSRPAVLDRIEAMGFKVFEGELNVNLIGVRSVSREANKFDDHLHLCYQTGGRWVEHVYTITTDPGTYWLANPSNVDGTAILVPGQYRGAYAIGLHRGKYEALVQAGKVAVYRDGDRDNVLDPDVPAEWGHYGINIHRASAHRTSTAVEKWSAGCQVFADPEQFAQFLSVVKASMEVYGDRVTYTLIGD